MSAFVTEWGGHTGLAMVGFGILLGFISALLRSCGLMTASLAFLLCGFIVMALPDLLATGNWGQFIVHIIATPFVLLFIGGFLFKCATLPLCIFGVIRGGVCK